jgi:glycosyltransferase involved in cell wall biosynthesis
LPPKNFIIITQYFPPEIGGGSQRSIGFTEELRKFGLNVIVVTPFPSYLMDKAKIKTRFRLFEKYTEDGITVYRTFVYASDRGNFFKRMFYYLSFTISAALVSLTEIRKINYVLTISPPLFTGLVGLILKYLKSAYFIFDIGDLWPESAIQLGFLKNRLTIWLSEKLERIIYRGSDSINVVTNLTLQKFQIKHDYVKRVLLVPNFVDTEKIKKTEKNIDLVNKLKINNKIVYGYAGNIGSAQGLKIITDAAKLTIENSSIIYLIIGDGIEKETLQKDIMEHGLDNVIFLPPVPRDLIMDYIALFDAMIIPLVKNELFKITIPSKLYECMAAELPVLLCVDGEAKKIMEKYNCGIFVEPENATMLAEKVNFLYNNQKIVIELGRNGRKGATQEFDRKLIVRKFYNAITNGEWNR